MANNKVDWEQSIANAIDEIDNPKGRDASKFIINIPSWAPYFLCLVLGFLIADLWLNNHSGYSQDSSRHTVKGGKVAVLMVAEDIQTFLNENGELPNKAPGHLADDFNIKYIKLDQQHFKLEMPFDGDTIVFDASENSLEIR